MYVGVKAVPAYGLGDDLSYVIVLLVTVAAFQYS